MNIPTYPKIKMALAHRTPWVYSSRFLAYCEYCWHLMAEYGEVLLQEHVHIQYPLYRDPDGKPTCVLDVHHGYLCPFARLHAWVRRMFACLTTTIFWSAADGMA